jgi:hypothetical protein
MSLSQNALDDEMFRMSLSNLVLYCEPRRNNKIKKNEATRRLNEASQLKAQKIRSGLLIVGDERGREKGTGW